jgi:Antitoxin SocA-like, Panacea domain
MQFDREKLKAVILYACNRCQASELGAVKLHKVLYVSDMLYYAYLGTPLTGATYRKRTHGPTCDDLLPALRELERAGAVEVREVEYFGYRKKEYLARAPAQIERLGPAALELLDDVIDFVCRDNTAQTISEYSHNRAWEMAEFGDVLSYNSVFQIFPTEMSPEVMDIVRAEVKTLEDKREQGAPLGGRVLGRLREGILQTRRSH